MSDRFDRLSDLDRFWDLSKLVPKAPSPSTKNTPRPHQTEGVEISVADTLRGKAEDREQGSVLTREIPSRSSDTRLSNTSLTPVGAYEPVDSLIHRVELKKWKCNYAYYGEFLADAIRYMDRQGEECEAVPFFSYVPQYNQLNESQLSYYFWFRQCAREGVYLPADLSYVQLYIYELINLGDRLDPQKVQDQLVGIWNAYGEKYPAITVKLADWICDYSLIHRLPPPKEGRSRLIAKVIALKEFFIPMPRGDVEGCARSLLRYCNSYDYKTSKFATPENLPLFDRHVHGVLLCAVRYYSADGRLLSGLGSEDSSLCRDAYAGALCVADEKYRIEVQYCSFSRSNELRFLVGDVVKYAENKLRAYLGIKSRMTVYSIPSELTRLIDEYFLRELPKRTPPKKEQEKQAYEALYELPRKSLSLADAQRIERESWDTTRELVDAFEESKEETEAPVPVPSPEPKETPPQAKTEESDGWRPLLGDLFLVLLQTAKGDKRAIDSYARKVGSLADVIAEQINEIAWDRMGDAVLEECDGGYALMEEYREELTEELLKEETT